MGKILNIGHRGAKGHAPENTLASFRKALELNVDGIELDVHMSADNEILVIHDATIDRTTSQSGIVNALTLSELKAAGSIPTLSEVLNLTERKCFVNIELKGAGTAIPVVNLIDKYIAGKNWNYSDFIISSFDWNALQEVRRMNNKIRIGVLTLTDLQLAIGFARFINAYSVHPHFHLLTKENTLQMQNNGFFVFPWTVNENEDIDKIKAFHVNGIITDFPDRL